jgi:activator of HSP90 ATPase
MPAAIHQEVGIAAPANQIYEALLDPAQFGQVTGRDAHITSQPGAEFTLFGGAISGRNIELVPGRRVVQAWRSNDWQEGQYSIVRFELTPKGDETTLVFDQAGYPEEAHGMLDGGWHAMYWEPLRKFLA